ncbi:hypothetical protein K4F52_007109 [Lecanicillium sp. MT-2017a]|nr:hypothetical protein K4F52_007109 [Lecanicillium sp. MT-2017a]
MRLSGFLTGLSVVGAALAAPFEHQISARALPSQDDFYTMPEGHEELAPGTVIRTRSPPANIGLGKADIKLQDAVQIMYKTTDSFDQSTVAISTVLIPHNADYGKVLSYQMAQDSANPDCAPSYSLQTDPEPVGKFGLFNTQVEILIVASALDEGWPVIVPDHEGLHAAFGASKRAGHTVLDGIRSALQANNVTGIDSEARLALWGYAGGSLVTSWAAELHESYAPELNIVGTAAGGGTNDNLSIFKATNKSPFAGLIATAYTGLAAEFPVVNQSASPHILPEYREQFAQVTSMCLVDAFAEFAFQDVLGKFDDPDLFFTNDDFVAVANGVNLGKATPKMPLRVLDEVIPLKGEDDLVDSYCSNGGNVQYDRDLVSGHVSLGITGAPKAFVFLRDVLNGKTQPAGCHRRTVVSTALSPSAALTVPSLLLRPLLDFLGKDVGPWY